MKSNLIELGYCHRPHGIKGEFSFHLFNRQESVLKKGMQVSLFPVDQRSSLKKEGEVFTIKKISFGNKTIVSLAQVTDRNRAEEIIPFSIHVSRESFPEAEEGEFYLSDLIGLKVLDNQSGEEIGQVKDISDNSVQVILEIRGKINTDLLFLEQFVPEVDIEGGFIKVNIPEYLGEK